MTQDKAALLELLEKATGPDKYADAEIHVSLGFCIHPTARLKREGYQDDTGFSCRDCGADSWGNKGRRGERLHGAIPAYTSSIDAALTLFKDEWDAVEALRQAAALFNPPYMTMWRVKRSLIIAALKAKDSQ